MSISICFQILRCDALPSVLPYSNMLLHKSTSFPCVYTLKPLYEAFATVGSFLDVFRRANLKYRTMCFKVCWQKTVLLTCDGVIGQKWREKRTPVYFVKFDPHQSHVKRKKKKSNALLSGFCRMWNSFSFVYLWY